MKVNHTEAGNGEKWHSDQRSKHLVQNEHQDPDMLKEDPHLVGDFDHHVEWDKLSWVSGLHVEQVSQQCVRSCWVVECAVDVRTIGPEEPPSFI